MAVLVLSHNKREATLRCVESVTRLRSRPLEIVVVDNGSSDGTADMIEVTYPHVRVVRSAVNLGAAGGRNYGLRWMADRVAYDYVLFLDDDATVSETALDALVAALRSDFTIGLVTPKAYRTGSPGILASAGGLRVRLARASIADIGAGAVDHGQYDEPRDVDACAGFAFLARREVLERVGGFDEAYNPYGWEEVDLSLRVRRAGYRIRYAPSAVVEHAGGTPGRGYRVPAYERRRFANFVRLARRHASPLEWVALVVAVPIRLTQLAIGHARRGDLSMLWTNVAGLFDRRSSADPRR